MMRGLLHWVTHHRAAVALVSALITAVGIWSFASLQIDAIPDITGVQVQINTQVPALAPEDTEKLVTLPITAVASATAPHPPRASNAMTTERPAWKATSSRATTQSIQSMFTPALAQSTAGQAARTPREAQTAPVTSGPTITSGTKSGSM